LVEVGSDVPRKKPSSGWLQQRPPIKLRFDSRAVVEMVATIFQIAQASVHRFILWWRLGLGCEKGAHFAQKRIESL
jgi:hypothetical protein